MKIKDYSIKFLPERLINYTDYRRFLSCLAIFITCISPYNLYAQKKADTLSYSKYPLDFSLNANIETGLNTNYKLKQKGNTLEKGNFNDIVKSKLALDLSIYKYRKMAISFGAFYDYYHIQFARESNVANTYEKTINANHYVGGFSMNTTFYTTLFNKHVTGNLNIIADGSEKGFEKIYGNITAIMFLKRTSTETLGIGVVGLVNTTSSIPVVPVIIYYNKLSPKWTLDIMPPNAYLRYSLNSKSRLSTGTSIVTDYFYIYPQNELSSKKYLYRHTQITAELVYEISLNKRLHFKVRGGSASTISSYIYDKKDFSNKIKVSHPMNGFINIGLSYGVFK